MSPWPQDGFLCLRRIGLGPAPLCCVMDIPPKEEAKEEENGSQRMASEAETGVSQLSKVPSTVTGRIEMAFHQAWGSSSIQLVWPRQSA